MNLFFLSLEGVGITRLIPIRESLLPFPFHKANRRGLPSHNISFGVIGFSDERSEEENPTNQNSPPLSNRNTYLIYNDYDYKISTR